MNEALKQRFEELVIAAPKDGIGNAHGMMNYITGLMMQAYAEAEYEPSPRNQ